MLALSRARFPAGVAAPMLDALAREPIWAAGIDYGLGTTAMAWVTFLNVHEGPQSISFYATVTPPHMSCARA